MDFEYSDQRSQNQGDSVWTGLYWNEEVQLDMFADFLKIIPLALS